MRRGAVRVWDPLVRIVHWSLAACVLADLFNDAGANVWHRRLGYAALALVVVRLGWGLVGSPGARLRAMAATALQAPMYVMRRAGSGSGYTAHNPLGAAMAFTLWALVIAAGATGWMLQLEAYWGDETLEAAHAALAYALAACIALHVTGALTASVRERTNLTKAMVTGDKPAAGDRSRGD